MAGYLDKLPTEVLLHIFKFLPTADLYKIKCVCKRFNNVLTECMHMLYKEDLLVTNQLYETWKPVKLTPAEKLRISHNWQQGKYIEHNYLSTRQKYLPCLVVKDGLVMLSRGKTVYAYCRKTLMQKNQLKIVYSVTNKDAGEISEFAYSKGYLCVGTRKNNIWMWCSRKRQLVLDQMRSHESDVSSVDFAYPFYVTGSSDITVKLWKQKKSKENVCCSVFHMNDKIWSCKLSDDCEKLCVGMAGILAAPICLLDVTSKNIKRLGECLRRGAGALDIQWEGNNFLWTCGYDSCLRRWDLRTNNCVQSWEDPHGSTLYCLSYDRVCTVMTGSQDYGRVTLWDTRKDSYVQMYYTEYCKGQMRSSPVYDLEFDAKCLYTVTDRTLNVLSFSGHGAPTRNYSGLFPKAIL